MTLPPGSAQRGTAGAVPPALLAAAGFEVIERGGAVYFGWVTGSPAGLLAAIYPGARLVQFVTAWAATRRPDPVTGGITSDGRGTPHVPGSR